MADQRQQPFRFRLPWLPGGPTPTPAPTPAPARPVAEPRPPRPATAGPMPTPAAAPARPVAEPLPPRPATAGPSRPPFRPAGVAAPTQPTPRPEVPSAPRTLTEPQTSIPKPTSPPKTEPPSKPLEPTGPRITTPEPRTPTPEVPSVTQTIAEAQTSIPKPTSQPKTEPPSKPLEPTGPRITTPEPKTEPPSTISTAGRSPPISPPKPPRQPPSPRVASQPPSPSRLTLTKPGSPRETTPTKPGNSPQRDPSPTVSSETIQKPSTSTPDHNESREVQRVPDEKTIIEQNGVQDSVNKPDTVLQPVAMTRVQPSKEEIVHRKEMIPTSKAGRSHNHKPFGEKAPLQKEIKEDISKFVHKLGISHGKQPLEGDKQLTVITLAGENRGASMTLSNETKKRESSIHIRRGYRINPDENVETSTDGEDSSKGKGKGKLSNSNTDEETTKKAYINSNVQGINNSLLFHGSVSTKNPGVRYVRSHNHPETSKGRHEGGNYETLKAECSGTQSEMLAYAPNVKRRCLRGLMMDSSDSDPEKPQRHGCHYGTKDKKKDKNIGVL